jgi:hypothetical protein
MLAQELPRAVGSRKLIPECGMTLSLRPDLFRLSSLNEYLPEDLIVSYKQMPDRYNKTPSVATPIVFATGLERSR